ADEGPAFGLEVETECGVSMISGAAVGPGRAAGEEQSVRSAEPDDAADAGARLGGAADGVGALAGDLRAEGDLLVEIVGERERGLPEVAVPRARVDHVAAAAEDAGSAGEILADPQGQKNARLARRRQARAGQDRARKDGCGKAALLVVE